MSLHIHRSERADSLAGALADVLLVPLADPFAAEVVGVPTAGIERWLSQVLSHRLGTSSGGRDGVCAGVTFPSVRRLVGTTVADAIGLDAPTDPWRPGNVVWPLLRVIDDAREQQWCAVLWSYLRSRADTSSSDDNRGDSRRWPTARRLADLFTSYAANRPEMIRHWTAGHDLDGQGRPLSSDRAWQAELWRRLRSHLGTPGPVERLTAACTALTRDPTLTALPERISVFGATRLSAEELSVLAAVAAHREVHLWLTHPSPALWRKMTTELGSRLPAPMSRSADPTVELAANRLLGYLGRDCRELQVRFATTPVAQHDHHHPAAAAPVPDSLLALVQTDIITDRPARQPAERPSVARSDRSVQFHASHGPDRQVEVLRELLVGMLAADHTLEPRDIVVMCPDIETFAPLISASFGLQDGDNTEEHPGHRLRVRLADRALRQLNPLLAVLGRILSLVDSRMKASALLDLIASAPVARRFGLSEDDLIKVHDLVGRSGVRWGLDAEHRRRFGMADFGQNTWTAGLDRLLLGVTMDEDGQHFIGTALPLDDVDSSDVEVLGRLAEAVDRIRRLTDDLVRPRPLSQWVDACMAVIQELTAVVESDSWQTSHAYGELGRLAESSEGEVDLSLPEVQALLAETFRGRPTRANFRTGTLTMCTMMPMRSVPHRVVCLLGLDDGVFPRGGGVDGDDILATDPWVGDRDPRSEDRQLLLDAVMAAREQLLVIYAGANPRTGASTPPAVPIGELLDALELTACGPDGGSLRDHIVVQHTLQPFDQANFEENAGLAAWDGGVFSFDRAALRGSRVAASPRKEPQSPYTCDKLPPMPSDTTVALDDLVRFFNHPAKALLRTRAGLYRADEEEQAADEIPITLDPLQRWSIGDRLLEQHLDGLQLDRLAAAEWRRGGLPPRVFGSQALQPILSTIAEVADGARPWRGTPVTRDILARLPSLTVTGTCPEVHGDCLVSVHYSRLSAKHRLQSWIRLLALTVTEGRPWRAITIGKAGRSLLGPVPATFAGAVLEDLAQLYWTGMSEPLPFGPKTSAEYARICADGKSVQTLTEKIARVWQDERDHVYESFFGPGVTFKQLLIARSIPAEERGQLAEPSRFGTIARRVWHPLLLSEELT
ncbi:MAG TPA: exodeoxyribonuclease V subunit gamma [Dermatophilaceae bacterium]|nr:exodeoxyribonuclease V subunit gamma [Dermatophilaceae bacterium]